MNNIDSKINSDIDSIVDYVKNDEDFIRYNALKKAISNNAHLLLLDKNIHSLKEKAREENDFKVQEKLLIEANKLFDEYNSHPLVTNFNFYQKRVEYKCFLISNFLKDRMNKETEEK